MSAVEFRAKEFGNGNGNTAVALVAGFDGKIEQFSDAATNLTEYGNDIVVYEYEPDALLSGDPQLLPSLISDLSNDFRDRTTGYLKHRYAGASMGAGLAWNMQKNDESAMPGAYAAAGADTAHLVMRNPLFRGMALYFHKIDPRKEFALKGYSEADIREIWKELHEPPTSGIAVVLGARDLIVRKKEVLPKIEAWRAADIDVKTLVLQKLGHTGVIRWFSDNTQSIVDLADSNNTNDQI